MRVRRPIQARPDGREQCTPLWERAGTGSGGEELCQERVALNRGACWQAVIAVGRHGHVRLGEVAPSTGHGLGPVGEDAVAGAVDNA